MKIIYLKENIFDDLDIEDLDDSEISAQQELELNKSLNNIRKSSIARYSSLLVNAAEDIVSWLQREHKSVSDMFFGFAIIKNNEFYNIFRDKDTLKKIFEQKIYDTLLNGTFHLSIEMPLYYGIALRGNQEKNYGKIIASFLKELKHFIASNLFSLSEEIELGYSFEELIKNIIFDVIKITNIDAVQYDPIEKKLYYQLGGSDTLMKFYFEDILNNYLKNENIVFLKNTSEPYDSLDFYVKDEAATDDKLYYDKLNHWIDNALNNQSDANKLMVNFRISAVNSKNSLNFLNYLADTIAPQADKFYKINVHIFTLMDRDEQNKTIVHGLWKDAVKKIRTTNKMSLIID